MTVFEVLVLLASTVSALHLGSTDDGRVDICSLPPVKKTKISCLADFSKWTFNKTTGTCEPYSYGGCYGTANLFDTQFDCIRQCDSTSSLRQQKAAAENPACSKSPVVGPCKSFQQWFYYNAKKGMCEPFTYGGCKGNDNKYRTLDECLLACATGPSSRPETRSGQTQKDTEGSRAQNRSVCSLPPVTGDNDCDADFLRWTFNSTSGRCEEYYYGGCGSTENLFITEEICVERCGEPSIEPRVSRDACMLAYDPGPCLADDHAYAFVKEKNRCELVSFGGCPVNDNNFNTAEECYQTCGGDTPSSITDCADIRCDLSKFQHYASLGCKPQYQPGACCPSRYICPRTTNLAVDSCTYRGVSYLNLETIHQVTEDNPCRLNCRCRESKIVCEELTCEIHLPSPGCTPVYEHGKCCPVGYNCANNSSEYEGLDVCSHGEQTYVKGQYMPSDNICERCICAEGAYSFTGVKLMGPICEDIHCPIQRPEPDCVSVYAEGVCCPVDYICPSQLTNKTIRVIPPTQRSGIETLPASVAGGSSTEDDCELPVDFGSCKAAVPSYFYNATSKECQKFTFGGCRGNSNRFDSLQACQERCKNGEAAPRPAVTRTTEPIRDICRLPLDVGGCSASKQRYFFNLETKKCKEFIYGGCRGNANNFHTEKECLEMCSTAAAAQEPAAIREVSVKSILSSPAGICSLPADEGLCDALFPMYFFNVATQSCESFAYGGCGGNPNRFNTLAECYQACEPPVVHPAVSLANDECLFGNVTIKTGDAIDMRDPCYECSCITPPDITCVRKLCPSLTEVPGAICQMNYMPGVCCPVPSCVSSNPPSIKICEGVDSCTSE